MYVMTIDQRGSSADVDRVPGLLSELAGLSTAGRFERSVGDEVQGVVERPDEVVEIGLHALRSGRWYVGIGVGAVDLPLPASPREGSGPAFVAARAAVDKAKAGSAHVPIAIVSGGLRRGEAAPSPAGSAGARACANAEAVLRLIGRLVQDRTESQWKVVDVLRSVQHGHTGTHGTQKVAAQKLGITEQSVSRALLRSGWQEEWAARPAAEMLLDFAHRTITGSHDAGSHEAGNHDAGSHEAGNHDAGSHDAGSHEAGSHDAGSHEAGNHDAGGQSKDRAQDTGRPQHPDTRIPDSTEGDR